MSSNSEKKRVPKPLKDSPPPPLPFAHQIKTGKDQVQAEKKEEKEEALLGTLDESTRMILQMKKMHDEIERMMNEILDKTGWSPNYLKKYLADSGNFSKMEWEEIQKQRSEFMDSIEMPKDWAKQAAGGKKEPFSRDKGASDTSIAKERRGKVAGARRKWIPMR